MKTRIFFSVSFQQFAMKVVVIIFAVIAISSCNRFVIDRKSYFEKLYQNMANQLLPEYGTLKLDDFEGVLNVTLMSKMFDGSTKFHSGFVSRIGKFALNSQIDREVWNDTDVCDNNKLIKQFYLHSSFSRF